MERCVARQASNTGPLSRAAVVPHVAVSVNLHWTSQWRPDLAVSHVRGEPVRHVASRCGSVQLSKSRLCNIIFILKMLHPGAN